MKTKKLKVFKMNDFDWVVAKSKENAIEWYKNETGLELEYESIVREVDKQKEGWFLPLANVLVNDMKYILEDILELEGNDKINARIKLKGKRKKKLYLIIPFEEIIEKDNLRVPSIICSTEH